MDYARADILRQADAAIARSGGPSHAEVYFKFTCPACGARCTFEEPNRLYEHGTCCECGQVSAITKAGFSLAVHLGRTP